MKKGDIVTLIVHGAGLVSEEEGHIIEEINDHILRLEDDDKTFHNKDGYYKTDLLMFGFWFEIKEI